MEKDVIEEIMKECNKGWEKILIKLFPNVFINVYHIARIKTINHIYKK